VDILLSANLFFVQQHNARHLKLSHQSKEHAKGYCALKIKRLRNWLWENVELRKVK